MNFRLRTILTAAFFVVSMIPLGIWAAWTSHTALQREIEEVEDRHLLLARNISAALTRYALDVSSAFDLAVTAPLEFRSAEELSTLLKSLHFRHVCIIDVPTRRVSSFVSTEANVEIPTPTLDQLIDIAKTNPSETTFTPVRGNAWNQPVIYLVQNRGDDTIAVGELSTDYFRATQQAVVFGEKGHAAIVDGRGNVIGHPRPDWVESIKNIAKVDPVKRMMSGETGVSRFYSPALKADMIAGFTTVPMTGWGVMIPQPFAELESHAEQVTTAALWLLLAGAALSAVLGWVVSGFIARPLQATVTASHGLAAGSFDVRADVEGKSIPLELKQLADDFNSMARELKALHENGQKALSAAVEASEAKSDFVARVSHELRTPLNSVIGFSGMIHKETHGPIQSKEYKEYASIIHEAGQQLLETIEDILSYARADGHGEDLQEAEINVVLTCEVVLDHHRRRADEAQVTLNLDASPELPHLCGDERKIRQILTHLVSNAVKFTPGGGSVTIQAALAEEGDLVIRISDTGIGMAADQVPIALQPFGQIENRLTRRFEGTGLGLPIARMLTELHGGSMDIESSENNGTTITIRFDRDRVVARD